MKNDVEEMKKWIKCEIIFLYSASFYLHEYKFSSCCNHWFEKRFILQTRIWSKVKTQYKEFHGWRLFHVYENVANNFFETQSRFGYLFPYKTLPGLISIESARWGIDGHKSFVRSGCRVYWSASWNVLQKNWFWSHRTVNISLLNLDLKNNCKWLDMTLD